MPNFLNAFAALLSVLSLVLVAIAMATNYWVRFDDRLLADQQPVSPLNPLVTNNKLPGLPLVYDLDFFGLWVGCHKERSFDKISCGYIGASCYSEVCWIRNKKDTVCLDSRVVPIQNCPAYQATRAMTIIATIFLIVGAAVLVVSICINSRNLSTAGGANTFAGGFFLMIAFAVFYTRVFKENDLDSISSIGWSFILLIVAWPIAIIAGLFGCFASFSSSKPQEGAYEDSE